MSFENEISRVIRASFNLQLPRRQFFTFHRRREAYNCKSYVIRVIFPHRYLSYSSPSYSSLNASLTTTSKALHYLDIIPRPDNWVMPKRDLTLDYLLVSNTYFGRFMKRNFGRKSMKKILIHGFMVCVWGDRKWTFSTTTVTHILRKRKEINHHLLSWEFTVVRQFFFFGEMGRFWSFSCLFKLYSCC